jgi:hypothetical protein
MINIKKIKECVHRTQMPPTSSEGKKEHNKDLKNIDCPA